MNVDETLNELLVNLFKDIMELEGKALTSEEFSDISNNDMHIIEAIGIEEPKKSSEVAKLMSITMGTLTKAIDALSRKGYVDRERGTDDKRVVRLHLTDKGRKAYAHHQNFHKDLINNIKGDLSENEMTVLNSVLAKLVDYFNAINEKN